MKIGANSIKLGNILVYEDGLWVVAKAPEHVKPGKGPAYVQVELKNLKTGTKVNKRLSSSDTVEKASLERSKYQYLYKDGSDLVLMDMTNFEQILVQSNILGEKEAYLTDNMEVEVETYDEKPLQIILPINVIVEIEDTQPYIKGAAVTSSYKNAKLTNGIVVMVPPYLTTGEKIIVKTEDNSFVSRAKE